MNAGTSATATTGRLRVTVAAGQCQGHGLCYARFPELFGSDDEGYAVVAEPVVDGSAARRAAEAVAVCPERAIALEEVPG